MKKTKSQESGSIHIVISVLIVIVIAGGVGFCVYNNLQKESKNSLSTAENSSISNEDADVAETATSESESVSSSTDLTLSVSDADTGYTLKYPSNWPMNYETKTKTASYSKNQTIVDIKSPDGNLDISFYVNVPSGGTMPDATITKLTDEASSNIYGVRYVELLYSGTCSTSSESYVAKKCGEGIGYEIGLYNTNINSGLPYVSYDNDDTVFVSLRIKSIDETDFSTKSSGSYVKALNDIRATDDFATAKKIIQSFYRK